MNLFFAILSAAVLGFQSFLFVNSFGEVAAWRVIALGVLCVVQFVVTATYIRNYKEERKAKC